MKRLSEALRLIVACWRDYSPTTGLQQRDGVLCIKVDADRKMRVDSGDQTRRYRQVVCGWASPHHLRTSFPFLLVVGDGRMMCDIRSLLLRVASIVRFP